MSLIDGLRASAAALDEQIVRLNEALANNDRDRLRLLRNRELAALELVELRTAVNVLESHDFRAELRDGVPWIQVVEPSPDPRP